MSCPARPGGEGFRDAAAAAENLIRHGHGYGRCCRDGIFPAALELGLTPREPFLNSVSDQRE